MPKLARRRVIYGKGMAGGLPPTQGWSYAQAQRKKRADGAAKKRSLTPGFGNSGSATPMQEMVKSVRTTIAMPTPFPIAKRCTLRYSDIYTMTSTSGSVALQVFKLNSAYDPDSTGAGHQPRFFDQFCTATGPYLNYRVRGWRWKANFGFTAASAVEQFRIQAVTNTTGSIASYPSAAELPGAQDGWLNQGFSRAILAGESTLEKTITKKATARAETNYVGAYNSDPTVLVYLILTATQTNGGSGTCQVLFTLEQDIEFTDPYPVGQS